MKQDALSAFSTNHKKNMYCSQVCYRAFLKRKYDASKKVKINKRTCPNCKQEFKTHRDNKIYCSVTCRFNYHCKLHPIKVYIMKERLE